ncbi:unnamed protein product, partial [Prorocentrum cordatum]
GEEEEEEEQEEQEEEDRLAQDRCRCILGALFAPRRPPAAEQQRCAASRRVGEARRESRRGSALSFWLAGLLSVGHWLSRGRPSRHSCRSTTTCAQNPAVPEKQKQCSQSVDRCAEARQYQPSYVPRVSARALLVQLSPGSVSLVPTRGAPGGRRSCSWRRQMATGRP